MKRWVLLIFCVNETLDGCCRKIQRKIERTALDNSLPCQVLFKRIERLQRAKDGLVNLRVLYEAMAGALSEKDTADLHKAVRQDGILMPHTAREGAGKMTVGIRSIECAADESAAAQKAVTEAWRLRGVNRALKKCERILVGLGFDEKQLTKMCVGISGQWPVTSG
ncbi:MAG: hypothetical protein FWE84_01340 [Firmicutes bacterium]|nr:hypothetical protein [Bacillota bacterium]